MRRARLVRQQQLEHDIEWRTGQRAQRVAMMARGRNSAQCDGSCRATIGFQRYRSIDRHVLVDGTRRTQALEIQ